MKIKRLHHVAIAATAMAPFDTFLQGALGLGAPHRESNPTGTLDIAVYPVGDSAIEVLQPNGPGSTVPDFIARRGEGLFHICLEVEDIEEAVAELAARGLKLVGNGIRDGHSGSRVAFIEPAGSGGVLFELLQVQP